MYKVTIIIPHKNVPHLLQRCIDSIPKRNDWKIVVVDDNSSPDIVDFDKFPGKNRSNVFIIYSKTTLGGGGARNAGLRLAEGKWLLFADADDFFHENLEFFLDVHFDSDADMIVFDTDSVMSDTMLKVNNRENIVALYQKSGDVNILRYCHHSVWGKMFRTNLIKENDIAFQEVAASNDAFFAAQYGYYAEKVVFMPDVLYCCTVRSGSICTHLTLENVQARIFVVNTINTFLRVRKVPQKYWMNMLGPLFNLQSISNVAFISAVVSYLTTTPLLRIIFDVKDSGKRLWGRIQGKVNDKDIKLMQKRNRQS